MSNNEMFGQSVRSEVSFKGGSEVWGDVNVWRDVRLKVRREVWSAVWNEVGNEVWRVIWREMKYE